MAWAIYGSFEAGVLCEIHADAKLTPTAYNAAAADLFVFTARRPMTVVGFAVEVTTAYTVPTTAQVLALDKRSTHNSDVGRLELATITMDAARADGHQYIKEFNEVDLDPGQQLVIEQKVQGAGGAGAGIPFILWYPRAEIPDLLTYVHKL